MPKEASQKLTRSDSPCQEPEISLGGLPLCQSRWGEAPKGRAESGEQARTRHTQRYELVL